MPAAGRAGAVERLEHALQLRRRDARAPIDDAHDHPPTARLSIARGLVMPLPRPRRSGRLPGARASPRTARARTDTGCPPEWRRAFSSTFTNARSICTGSTLTSGSSWIDRQAELLRRCGELDERGADQLLHGGPVAPRLRRAGFQSRKVEQVVDEPRQPARLLADHRRHLGALVRGQRRRADRLAGGGDRGQRRAQVVRHGAQQRRLDRVGPAQGGRLDDIAKQPLALQRRAQQRLQRRNDALLQAAQARPPGCPRRPAACPVAWCRRAAGTRRFARRPRRRPSRSPPSSAPALARDAPRRSAVSRQGSRRATAGAPSPPPGRPPGGARRRLAPARA